MKNLLLGLLSGAILASCTQNTKGTSTEVDTVSAEMQLQAKAMMDQVVLTAIPEKMQSTAVPDSLLVDMVNNTKDTIITGTYYDIQLQTGNDWVTVLPKQAFNDIGYGLSPAESKKFDVKLWRNEVKYNDGVYRVVKYFIRSDYKETRERDSVTAVFHVE